ncbi:MAG TPA: histidine phosphatase family protein [Candidatus Paceibacterota bacterium]|jgi:probable phosphoglycerate mutase|nr:histidine phosphatase family protein [Candidatus Paceibacterota bacterium]
MEKVIYFVRHGQSEDNIAPVFQSVDSPLNDKGRAQAKSIAERVSKISFETLIASLLPRARETAEIVARVTGRKPEYSDLFVERIKPKGISGKSYEDEMANTLWRNWEKSLDTPGMRVADGENFDDIIARADKALTFLKNRIEASIVVVTHGYFLRTVVARALLGNLLSGEIFGRFHRMAQMENTGLTVLKYQTAFEEDYYWRLWIYNDHAHLAE